jgi:hypothetical protein
MSCVYQEIGVAADEEYENEYPGKDVRPDNVLHSFCGSKVHLDVVGAQSVSNSAERLRRHAVRDGAAARAAEKKKRDKYAAAGIGDLNNVKLIPFALEDGGRIGPAARKHLADLAEYCKRVGYCEPWFFWSAFAPQINTALMEGNLRQVRMARKNIVDVVLGGAVAVNAEEWAGGPPHGFDEVMVPGVMEVVDDDDAEAELLED